MYYKLHELDEINQYTFYNSLEENSYYNRLL